MRKPRPGDHRRAGKEHPGGCGAETGTPGPLCSHRLSRSPERQPWVLPLSSSAQRCGSRACCGHLTTEQPTLTLTSPTGLEEKGSVSPPTTQSPPHQSRVQARSRQRPSPGSTRVLDPPRGLCLPGPTAHTREHISGMARLEIWGSAWNPPPQHPSSKGQAANWLMNHPPCARLQASRALSRSELTVP